MEYKIVEKKIVKEIAATLDSIDVQEVEQLVVEIEKANRVFFVGVGRVLLSLEGIAKRLAHLGIQTVVVGQITEPAITENDLLIVGSGSGESSFPLAIAKKAKSFKAKVAHIGSNANSSMKEYSDFFIRIPVQTKLALPGEISSVQPMTSLFEQCLLLLGDSIALMMIEEKSIDMPSLWQYHANLE
ncbi:6-phospho-3-hexuloisomerase [Enterococcus dongliensis]|uniref:6-phospho-3-hexuloisomerase n=1 Tax=Enterococcus dongliensis TaxID=2559925 RepID=UPI00288D4CA8|nr:6-phospho-3-hexuloisomerase [Enterococcus dongliensis]MDT2674919.1 SIS domain-containing protein [Enterococcus dongliensis]